MVTAKSGDDVVKILLHNRFQEAIDEAAMRLGSVDSDSYLEGWRADEWVESTDAPSDLAANIAKSLEEEFSQEQLDQILNEIGTAN